jgi:hypothetical protein
MDQLKGPNNGEHRRVIAPPERQELAEFFAKTTVDLFLSRLSAAADEEERATLEARGRYITELFKKWRFRVLCALGVVGFEVVTRVHVSWEKATDLIIKLLGIGA